MGDDLLMTDLAIRTTDNVVAFEPIATRERRDLLKRTICRDATDDELDLFIAVCNRRRLDPFVGQIHFVKRRTWNSRINDFEEVGTHQTGIDGHRLIAKRTGEYAGRVGPWWCGNNGQWRDVWLQDEPPAAAKVGVRVAGHPEPIYAIARWKAYVQTKRDGKPNAMWSRMDAEQLAKCAEALALRVAFPEELSGIYTDDEMAQAAVDTVTGEIGDSGRLGGEPEPPTQPAGSTVPTAEQINAITHVDQARQLLVGLRETTFADQVKWVVSGGDAEAWRKFWRQNDLDLWQSALLDGVEAYEQHQHELSGGADGPPPPVAAPSDQASTGPVQAGARGSASAHPGPVDSPTRSEVER